MFSSGIVEENRYVKIFLFPVALWIILQNNWLLLEKKFDCYYPKVCLIFWAIPSFFCFWVFFSFSVFLFFWLFQLFGLLVFWLFTGILGLFGFFVFFWFFWFVWFFGFHGFFGILGNVSRNISREPTLFLLQLDEKNDIQTREQPVLARLAQIQLANIW